MKNSKTILMCGTAMFLLMILAYGCKKNEPTATPDNTVADSYVGVWNMKDTAYETHFGVVTPASYNFTIAKKDANSVYMYNFDGNDTTVFSVTATALAYVSGASGSGASVLSTSTLTRSGNHIYFSEQIAYGDIKSGTATKQ